MSNRILLSLLLFYSSYTINAQTEEYCKIMESEGATAKFKANNQKSAAQTAAYDVKFYRLNLELDPRYKHIDASVTTYFQPQDSALNELVFDFSDSLKVDSVIYHTQSIPFSQPGASVLKIQISNAIGINVLDSVSVFYHGTPFNLPGSNAFRTDTTSNGDSVIWTLSEPYGAQDWWPCKNSLTDKADSIELIIQTPEKYKVASHGTLLSIDTLNGIASYHYKSNYPIVAYLVAVAVADYNFYEEYLHVRNDSILMQHFLYPSHSLALSSSGMEEFMQFFDSLFGPYPFMNEKYGHADFTIGGGMEHQTISFMGGYGGELKAHELAHQWFGDKITCASWSDLWLNEGFATYITALTYEFGVVHNQAFHQVFLAGMERRSLGSPNGSVYKYDTTNVGYLFNQMVYSKGAMALHMLRWTIGDSAFFEGVRNYISDTNLVYSFANTEQLKAHFELSSNQNLSEFFDDWVYGKGFPTLDSYWSQSNNQFELIVHQSQSNASVSFFDIKVPYRLFSGNWDTLITVNPSFTGEHFYTNINHPIDSIQLDPENWILNQVGLITSLNKKNLESNIKLYPNPVNDVLNIELPFNVQLLEVSISDASGRLIRREFNQNNINLERLLSGLYIAEIKTSKGSYRKKLIKN